MTSILSLYPQTVIEPQTLEAPEPLACKCIRSRDGSGRKLIVCIDGTSNRFGEKNSNVVEFYSHIDKAPDQLTYYNSGIGTYVEPSLSRLFSFTKQWLDNHIDLAIAWNFRKTILGAYRWLSDHYKEGDQIYLFGFSRGAYQVRTLAAMIETVGLIFPGNQEQIPFAYQLYEDQSPSGFTRRALDRFHHRLFKEHLSQSRSKLAAIFKKTFSRPGVRSHFVGAWDTVSSVGVFRANLLQLTNTCDHICFFRHALALDERRVKFMPEYGTDSGQHIIPANSPEKPSENASIKPILEHADSDSSFRTTLPQVKEVWFAGSHSDIGGGNSANPELDLRRPSLLWIRHEAMLAGLRLRPLPINTLDWEKEESRLIEVTNSMRTGWWLLELLPLKWKSHAGKTGYTWRPHAGTGRTILPDQMIHISVHNTKEDYTPRARFQKGGSKDKWSRLLKARGPYISAWPRRLDPLLKADLQLETASYDQAMLTPLIYQIHDTQDRPELLQYLMYIASTQGGRAILAVPNVIPILCRLPRSRNRNALLIKLADSPVDRLYESAVISSASDADTLHLVLDVHMSILRRRHFTCGAKALTTLARYIETRPVIISGNAIPMLVVGLGSSRWPEVDACAVALSILARYDDCRQALVDADMISFVTTLLTHEHPDKLVAGAYALRALVGRKEFRPTILEANTIPCLVTGLRHESDRARYACGKTLAHLSGHDDFRHAILEADVIGSIIQLLDSGDLDKVVGAAYALHVLAVQDAYRPVILKANPMSSLLAGLGCNSEAARYACGRALADLAGDDDGLDAILRGRVVSPLVEMLESEDIHKRTGGACGLYFLAWHESISAVINNTLAPRRLSILARSAKGDLEVWTRMAIRRLSKQDE